MVTAAGPQAGAAAALTAIVILLCRFCLKLKLRAQRNPDLHVHEALRNLARWRIFQNVADSCHAMSGVGVVQRLCSD